VIPASIVSLYTFLSLAITASSALKTVIASTNFINHHILPRKLHVRHRILLFQWI
jgi:hypothetical protein